MRRREFLSVVIKDVKFGCSEVPRLGGMDALAARLDVGE
jgi:hypothetical protein